MKCIQSGAKVIKYFDYIVPSVIEKREHMYLSDLSICKSQSIPTYYLPN